MNRKVADRPVSKVKPQIRIPDSTTTTDSGEEQDTLMMNEEAIVDVEAVTSDDSDDLESGWLATPAGMST